VKQGENQARLPTVSIGVPLSATDKAEVLVRIVRKHSRPPPGDLSHAGDDQVLR